MPEVLGSGVMVVTLDHSERSHVILSLSLRDTWPGLQSCLQWGGDVALPLASAVDRGRVRVIAKCPTDHRPAPPHVAENYPAPNTSSAERGNPGFSTLTSVSVVH